MSVQQYIQATGITNAGPDDHFYELTTGMFAGDIVRVTQERSTEDLDDDGAPDRICFKMSTVFVTSDNQPRVNSKGTPFQAESTVNTLPIAEVAAQRVDEEVHKAGLRVEEIQKVVNWRVVIGE